MRPPSLLFMAQPAPNVRLAIQQALAAHSLDQRLGNAIFDPQNWHQSLSHPLPSSPALCKRMVDMGSHIDASAFTVVLNRIRGTGPVKPDNTIHWALHATTRPTAFDALVTAIRESFQQLGLAGMPGHTPHVTVTYCAPGQLTTMKIRPIAWRIDELLLVESRNDPYRYHLLARWPLRAAPAGLESQQELW